MKLSKRELIIFIVCVILVVLYTLFKLIVVPLNEHGGDMGESIALAERKLAKNQQIILSGSAVEGQYKKIVDILGVSGSEGAEFSEIVTKMEGLAKEADIHVANVQPQRAYSKEAVRVFPVELTIDGSWPSIVKFLYLIQAQPNYFNVEELNLEKYSSSRSTLRGRIVLSRVRIIGAN